MKINFATNSINFSSINFKQKEKSYQMKPLNISFGSNDVFVKTSPSKKNKDAIVVYNFDDDKIIKFLEKILNTKIHPHEREKVLNDYREIISSLTDEARQIFEWSNTPTGKRKKMSKITEDIHISTKDFYGINNQVLSHLYSSFKYIQDRKNTEIAIEAYEYDKYLDANIEVGDSIKEEELNSEKYKFKMKLMKDILNIEINEKNQFPWFIRFEAAFNKLTDRQKTKVFAEDKDVLNKLSKLIGSFDSLTDKEKSLALAEYTYRGNIDNGIHKLPVITYRIFKEKPNNNEDEIENKISTKTRRGSSPVLVKKSKKPLSNEQVLELLEEKKVIFSKKQYDLFKDYFTSGKSMEAYSVDANLSDSRFRNLIRQVKCCLENMTLEDYFAARKKLSEDFKILIQQGKITSKDMTILVEEHILAQNPKYLDEIFTPRQLLGVKSQLGRIMKENNIETILPLLII